MNRVALVIPYFGKFPEYFPLWLKSASCNDKIDFLIFTDDKISEYSVPKNVKVIDITFEEIKYRISNYLDFKFILNQPYKLCDYRPIYGLIFQDYLKNYQFWGYCDLDVIWGNLDNYITDELLDNYDRLYRRGHLCIYRNVDKINKAAITMPEKGRISYRDVYKHKYGAHYDEGRLIETLITQVGGMQWEEDNFADISYFHREFVLMKHDKICESVSAFRWNEGRLLGIGINGNLNLEKEYSYIHLQKRKMKYRSDLSNDFLITPEEFLPYSANWRDMAPIWQKSDSNFESRARYDNFRNQLKNIREGALIFRIKKMV